MLFFLVVPVIGEKVKFCLNYIDECKSIIHFYNRLTCLLYVPYFIHAVIAKTDTLYLFIYTSNKDKYHAISMCSHWHMSSTLTKLLLDFFPVMFSVMQWSYKTFNQLVPEESQYVLVLKLSQEVLKQQKKSSDDVCSLCVTFRALPLYSTWQSASRRPSERFH